MKSSSDTTSLRFRVFVVYELQRPCLKVFDDELDDGKFPVLVKPLQLRFGRSCYILKFHQYRSIRQLLTKGTFLHEVVVV